jgi:hypothetical protein
MKIRMGFVSNSSSCSFLIYGVMIANSKCTSALQDWCDDNDYTCSNPFDDEYYIGKSWDSISDDETGKQFKEKVEAALKTQGLAGFSTHEQAWTDN